MCALQQNFIRLYILDEFLLSSSFFIACCSLVKVRLPFTGIFLELLGCKQNRRLQQQPKLVECNSLDSNCYILR